MDHSSIMKQDTKLIQNLLATLTKCVKIAKQLVVKYVSGRQTRLIRNAHILTEVTVHAVSANALDKGTFELISKSRRLLTRKKLLSIVKRKLMRKALTE